MDQHGQYRADLGDYFDPYDIDWNAVDIAGFAADGQIGVGRGEADVPFPPQPPDLQIQAQLDDDGNWHYPSADQKNRELRIQCEAFRAGVAARPGANVPFRATQSSALFSTPAGNRRKVSRPTTRRISKPARREIPKGKRKKTSFAQPCTCPKAATFVPPRPANAFMIYRKMYQTKFAKALRDQPSLRGIDKHGREETDQAAISRLASEWWKDLKDRGEAGKYFELYEKEKQTHAEMFPDYKYNAGMRHGLKWGDETCTCGAYQANEAKKRERELEVDKLGLETTHNEYWEVDREEEGAAIRYISDSRTLKRRAPHATLGLGEPAATRNRISTIANTAHNAGYATGCGDASIFPTESYGNDLTDVAYNGAMDDNTVLYALPVARRQHSIYDGEQLPPQTSPPAYNTRSRSRSRTSVPNSSTFAPPDFNVEEMTEEDLQAMLEGLEVPDGAAYDIQFSPLHERDQAGSERQTQDEDVRKRGSSGESFSSLFDVASNTAQRSSGSRKSVSRQSFKGGLPSPANLYGRRRSSRRSRG